MGSGTYEYELSRENDDEEVLTELVIHYIATPYCRGARDSYGVPLEPDDEPDLEIELAETTDGEVFELTKDETETIEEEIWQHLLDKSEDYDY